MTGLKPSWRPAWRSGNATGLPPEAKAQIEGAYRRIGLIAA